MEISWLRDLIIVIYGILGILVTIFLLVMGVVIFRRAKEVLDSARSAVDDARQISTIVGEAGRFVQGIRQGFAAISKVRGGKEKKKQ